MMYLHVTVHVTCDLISGPILTGGTKVDGNWLWEQVTTEDESQSDLVLLTPLESLKWFPGIVKTSILHMNKNLHCKNKCNFTPTLVVAELPLILV